MRDYQEEFDKRVAWIRNLVESAGCKGIIYGNSGGRYLPASNLGSRARKRKLSFFLRHQYIRECGLGRSGALAVYYGNAPGRAFLRSPYKLEVLSGIPLEISGRVLPFYHEGNVELFAGRYQVGSVNSCGRLGVQRQSRCAQDEYGYNPFHYQFFSFLSGLAWAFSWFTLSWVSLSLASIAFSIC